MIGTPFYLEKYKSVKTNLDDDREAVVRFEATLIQNTLLYSTKNNERVIPILLSGTPKIVFHHWCFEMIKFLVILLKTIILKKLLKLVRDVL